MNKKAYLLVLAVIIAAGCGPVKPRPPAFNLYERQKLVVLPMENLTQDPALGRAIEDDVLGGLVRMNPCPIAEESAVSALIARQRTTNMALEQDEKLRQSIIDSFKADTIMYGTISTYTEDVREEDPVRLKTSYKPDTFKWGYNDAVTVVVESTVKLIDANTGNVLWVRKARGDGIQRSWRDLPWPGENAAPPAEGWNRLKGKGDAASAAPAAAAASATPAAPGAPAAPGSGQTINIIVQNVNQNTQAQAQTQTQTQTQTQQQTQSVAEKAAPKLLYQTDSNVSRARSSAISQTVSQVLNDYRGWGGWTPAPKAK